ncbi:MAG TPA: class I SAM-dependent methyltransferase [Acidimicrobiales bacterium]|nr:class I SAM-dependent methyltransferase [Acidimicrobiales bacterium]
MSNPWSALGRDPDEYDRRFAEEERAGRDMHGEADFVCSLGDGSVLDAGCGTGRVAIELARRGLEVEGVDLDPAMLAAARRKAPEVTWHLADLADLDLGRRFDVVVLAGNVMIFLTPGTEASVVAAAARHLVEGGALVSGFQLNGVLDLATYDAHSRTAGLELAGRWSTWDREPWSDSGDYAVSLHRTSW